MKPDTRLFDLPGPAGVLTCAVDEPVGTTLGVAVLCHPHPLHGGTLDNKVVQTLARACVHLGYRAVRFNFRGVAGSAGQWDEGQGEVDDALAVVAAQRLDGVPLILGGFSFGAYVAAQAASRLATDQAAGLAAHRLVLVGPATSRFAMPAVPADSLVIHGEADPLVPVEAGHELARLIAGAEADFVPGMGHDLPPALMPRLADRIVANARRAGMMPP